jgi:hypothetical protein
MLLAAAGGRRRAELNFQGHAATIVRGAWGARVQCPGAQLAPEGVPACPLLAIAVPGIVEAMPPRFAAARRQRIGRRRVAFRVAGAIVAGGQNRLAGQRGLSQGNQSPQRNNPTHSPHSVAPFKLGAGGRELGVILSLRPAPCFMLPACTHRRLTKRAVALVTRGFDRAGRIAWPDACSRSIRTKSEFGTACGLLIPFSALCGRNWLLACGACALQFFLRESGI